MRVNDFLSGKDPNYLMHWNWQRNIHSTLLDDELNRAFDIYSDKRIDRITKVQKLAYRIIAKATQTDNLRGFFFSLCLTTCISLWASRQSLWRRGIARCNTPWCYRHTRRADHCRYESKAGTRQGARPSTPRGRSHCQRRSYGLERSNERVESTDGKPAIAHRYL